MNCAGENFCAPVLQRGGRAPRTAARRASAGLPSRLGVVSHSAAPSRPPRGFGGLPAMSIVTCEKCGAKNRVDERVTIVGKEPVCGRCGAKLPGGGGYEPAGAGGAAD